MALVFVIMYVFICGFGGFLFVCLLLRSSIKTKNKCHEERKLVIDKINEAMRAFSVGDYVYRTLGSNSHFYYRIESIVFGRYEEKFSLFNSKV